MNTKVLKDAERKFLKRYPGGFTHPDMIAIGKKHKMEQLEAMAQDSFAKQKFNDPNDIIAELVKLVSRSSMISMFEKPKFRDMTKALNKKDKERFAEGLYELLHGKENVGFDQVVSELQKRKLAKWTLATAVQAYYCPQKDLLIKPTTTKLIIGKLELNLEYDSTPSWTFYRQYRKTINDIKSKVNNNLSPNNPAFCGFLMMALEEKLSC